MSLSFLCALAWEAQNDSDESDDHDERMKQTEYRYAIWKSLVAIKPHVQSFTADPVLEIQQIAQKLLGRLTPID